MHVDRALLLFANSLRLPEQRGVEWRQKVDQLPQRLAITELKDSDGLGREFALVRANPVGDIELALVRYGIGRAMSISTGGREVPGALLLSCSADVAANQLMLELCIDLGPLEDITEILTLSHSHYGNDGLKVNWGARAFTSIQNAMLQVWMDLGLLSCDDEMTKHIERFRLAELRGVGTDDPQSVPSELYGLLTADEGWQDVPAQRAKALTDAYWSSRGFLWVNACGSSVVVLNNKTDEYKERASDFFSKFSDASGAVIDKKSYFLQDFTVAGLDHGVLFACENAIDRVGAAKEMMGRIEEHRRKRMGKEKDALPTIRFPLRDVFSPSLQSASTGLRSYLDRVRETEVWEVNDMLQLILSEFGAKRYEQYVRESADVMDEDVGRVGMYALARLAVLIALVSLIATVISLVLVFTHL